MPPTRVDPVGSEATAVGGVRPAASSYAWPRSFLACSTMDGSGWFVPCTIPGGKPVTAEPGLTPRSPVMVVDPVLVTVWPARTAKFAAVPRSTAVGPAANATCPPASIPIARVAEMPAEKSNLAPWICLFILPSPSKVVVNFLDRRGECRSLVTRLETDDDEFGHLWDLVVHLACQSAGTKCTAGRGSRQCRAWN